MPRTRRIIVLGIVVAGVAVLLLIGTTALGLYRYDWNNRTTRVMTRMLPYPAAVVNTEIIRVDAYRRTLDTVHALVDAQRNGTADPDLVQIPPDEQIDASTLDRMVEQTLIRQLNAARGITIADADRQRIVTELAAQLGGGEQLDQKLQSLYGWDRSTFVAYVIDPYLERSVLERAVAFDDTIPETTEARTRAEAARARLQDGEAFATVASAVSEDESTKSAGGDLGFIRPGDLVGLDEFVEALGTMEPGDTSGLVRTRLGTHIILLEERVAADGDLPARDHVRHMLFRGKDFDTWLLEQQRAARIYRFL
ncbi:MAG: peptidylprolyl isomerase [Candidatus Kerfeldbacteria bacterium]|nr:peptidylprolyl isomerase [Candidatus Kerfeldbacteria bacterium]